MQTNISYLKEHEIKSLNVGDKLSDRLIDGVIIKVHPPESTGWGITFSFTVENKFNRQRVISIEL